MFGMIRYLSLIEVLELHRRIIEQSGGWLGIRNLTVLESAIANLSVWESVIAPRDLGREAFVES